LIEKTQPKFQEIWSNFCIFANFWHKKQVFLPYAPRHMALAFARGLQIKKTWYFYIFHEKLHFPTNGQEIWAGFEPSKR